MSKLRQTNCSQCIFCQFAEKDGVKWQTGCQVSQIEKYQVLKERVDPAGLGLDNSVYKYAEQGDLKSYIINSPCCFQRSQKWLDDQGSDFPTDKEQQREYVFQSIPFEYTLVVISNGNVKQTIRTCKSVCNGTLTPTMTEIIYPYKLLADKSKEELFIALEDTLAKGDFKEQHPWWKFNIRQVVDPQITDLRSMILDAIQSHGRFWLVVLQAGEKVDEGFIESIKRQYISELVDIQYVGLSPESAIIIHPIIASDMGFATSAAFKYKNGTLVQECPMEWVGIFYRIN
jgi:hypothetical protein